MLGKTRREDDRPSVGRKEERERESERTKIESKDTREKGELKKTRGGNRKK